MDTTVQEKAIAHPTESRLLEIARHKVVSAAKRCGILLMQTFAKEAKELRRKAGGYAQAKQFKRLKKAVKRHRTILGVIMREVKRELNALTKTPAAGGTPEAAAQQTALPALETLLERVERIRTQRRHDKNKLYALHAPQAECISEGKIRKHYEFGVKVSMAVTHRQGPMVGASSFPGKPFDGHTLIEQQQKTTNLLQNTGRSPNHANVDLGFGGVDVENPGVQIILRGKYKTLTALQRRWLKCRQVTEPAVGHMKSDHRMDRCWLAGPLGDALNALSCAAGYNARWLMRTILEQAAKAAKAIFLALFKWALWESNSGASVLTQLKAAYATATRTLQSAVAANQRDVRSLVALSTG